jgi:hypothetical protein
MTLIKSKVINSTSKFLLNKQKLKNLLKIHSLLKDKLLKYNNLFKKSKKLKTLSNYSLLYKNMWEIQNEINKSTSGKRNLIINDIFLDKSKVYIGLI